MGGAGADTLDGGYGNDTVSYATASAAVTVNMFTASTLNSDAAGDILINIENLIGTAYSDSLTGDDSDNVLSGGIGADILNGGDGIDTVAYENSTSIVYVNFNTNVFSGGEASGDVITNVENITGSAYGDWLEGNASSNLLMGRAGNDTIVGHDGDDILYGEDGNDTLYGANGDDTLYGGVGNDSLSGGAGVDAIYGGDGNDTLYGGNDGDMLFGEDGNDTLYGDGGNEILIGGLGQDMFAGGVGSDTFVFTSLADSATSAYDTIFDFQVGLDKIDMSGLGFSHLDNTATPTAGDLGMYISGGNTFITDGNDFTLMLTGNRALTDSDFIFA